MRTAREVDRAIKAAMGRCWWDVYDPRETLEGKLQQLLLHLRARQWTGHRTEHGNLLKHGFVRGLEAGVDVQIRDLHARQGPVQGRVRDSHSPEDIDPDGPIASIDRSKVGP